jgi:hypothetical protein
VQRSTQVKNNTTNKIKGLIMNFPSLRKRCTIFMVSKLLCLGAFFGTSSIYAYTKDATDPQVPEAVVAAANQAASVPKVVKFRQGDAPGSKTRSGKKVVTSKTLPAYATKSSAKEVGSPHINKSAGLLIIENGKTTPVTQTPLGKATTKTAIQSEEVVDTATPADAATISAPASKKGLTKNKVTTPAALKNSKQAVKASAPTDEELTESDLEAPMPAEPPVKANIKNKKNSKKALKASAPVDEELAESDLEAPMPAEPAVKANIKNKKNSKSSKAPVDKPVDPDVVSFEDTAQSPKKTNKNIAKNTTVDSVQDPAASNNNGGKDAKDQEITQLREDVRELKDLIKTLANDKSKAKK